MNGKQRRAAFGGAPGGGQSAGRPSLTPANPLSVTRALLQVAILLGIPLLLLVVGKFLVRAWFPGLGY
jgi:hypothetical protein